MKRELLTLLCMTLICASVMLGIMGVYRIFGSKLKHDIAPESGTKTTAFKSAGIRALF